jgi:hypothetical protein
MCEGCDTLCLRCQSQMDKCEKCDCFCHCGQSCIDCGCVGCKHENSKETYQNNTSEARTEPTRLANKL